MIMSNQVQYIVEWTINEGALDTVKRMAAETVEAVNAKEPKMMAFHWYVNEDESKFYLIEWFAGADAIVDHFENVGKALSELFNYAQISRFEVFGDLTEKSRAAVEQLGAQVFSHWNGFTRLPV
jgi:quinol monooxygenase YgiN